MHDEHYGLRGRAFQPAPDPRFWFDSIAHTKAMVSLRYALDRGDGSAVVTADAGMGKTILMGRFAGEIERDRHHVVQIASPHLRPGDLIWLVARAVGVEAQGLSDAALFSAIQHHLRGSAQDGQRLLLLIDDAQALLPDSLDTLRQLTHGSSGIQIFLFAEPSFRAELGQRMIATAHLAPMEVEEVDPYLRHRLRCVGWQGRPGFTREACAALQGWSGGIPRRLNRLADRVLLRGGVEQAYALGAPDVAAAIEDIEREEAGAAGVLEQRVSDLETQLHSQQAALRHVLELLTAWVDQDEGGRATDLRALRTTLG